MEIKSPKVFLAHACEDKAGFVLGLGKKLQAKGIDVWLDKWEMFPGDSIVDKIFTEGLEEADAVIVILSNNSVVKPWVKEELNTSIVNKITKGTKLIPVVIDDCDVPLSLKATFCENIRDCQDYEESLERIVASIFGYREKASLGPQPQYVQLPVEQIVGLTKTDSLVLRLSCEIAIDQGFMHIETTQSFQKDSGISEPEILESLEILDGRGFIKLIGNMNVHLPSYNITPYGFQEYASVYILNYQEMLRQIMTLLTLESSSNNQSLSEQTGYSNIVIDNILDLLELNGYIKQTRWNMGLTRIDYISPEIRRVLEEPI